MSLFGASSEVSRTIIYGCVHIVSPPCSIGFEFHLQFFWGGMIPYSGSFFSFFTRCYGLHDYLPNAKGLHLYTTKGFPLGCYKGIFTVWPMFGDFV